MTRDEYVQKRESVDFADEVAIGTMGIDLHRPGELDQVQEGYGGEDWDDGWLVIATDIATGDPIMLDTSSGEVLTAMHGQGEWDPDRTASSVDGFFAALEAFRELASVEGREDPESEPVPRDELDRFLAKVREADPGADLDWWTGIIYAGEEPPAA